MSSQFIAQVQWLMKIQQIKQAEILFERSNYTWLCSKRVSFVWLSTKQEMQIRNSLSKVSSDQQVEVMKKMIKWLEDNPDTDAPKIPEIVLSFLENSYMVNLISQANFSRMATFRNSLRRLSIISNRIVPFSTNVSYRSRANRSVTFNDNPVVHKISS
ncbi:uncharacterized protein [Leptinotarsa decemlineata]|uniref:uncharacterized protein n=1 Tax=Leptinotarsa decemlineata TaxID=7539 RepID=UPI000C252BC2|nr:uncharacterized protein LOC111516581 [Leptinotarsa decemlineata]